MQKGPCLQFDDLVVRKQFVLCAFCSNHPEKESVPTARTRERSTILMPVRAPGFEPANGGVAVLEEEELYL